MSEERNGKQCERQLTEFQRLTFYFSHPESRNALDKILFLISEIITTSTGFSSY